MLEWLTAVNNFVWGPCMLVLLFGTGLYLTIGLRFFTIRNFARGLRHAWAGRRPDSEKGEISPFNALMTALAEISAPATSWVLPRPFIWAARARCSGCG